MPELILGPMLRHVSDTTATVWIEADEPCSVRILDTETRTFSVAGHHFALAIVEGLQSGCDHPYEVMLDGAVRWPDPASTLPPSRIRTTSSDQSTKVVFGSCRTAAPHTEPWALDLSCDERGRGVDALYAYATAMVDQASDQWPDLAVFLGDQVYADDSSPKTRDRVAAKRSGGSGTTSLPETLVDGFEEFTWLYEEAWSPPLERWFFSNVASVMIFDDHDMIDDWNVSAKWVTDIRCEPWWEDHVIGGLMTYWLYQHLGNLSPAEIRSEGILAALMQAPDGEDILRQWAKQSEEFTPVAGGYRFNFVRDVGRVRLVMIDARNARVLKPGNRKMVDDDEWAWITEACSADVDHLLIGTSLPVFVPGGLHDLQAWSEPVCDGKWGRSGRRAGEWLREKADMEDWPAFGDSFARMVELLGRLGSAGRQDAPATISVLSGDIHFSFASQVHFNPAHRMTSRVHQLVNSPIRNALTGPERTAMRLGMSRFASVLGRVLRRAVGLTQPDVRWAIDSGPVFDNCLGEIRFSDRTAQFVVRAAEPFETGRPQTLTEAFAVDLAAGATDVDNRVARWSRTRSSRARASRPRAIRTRSRLVTALSGEGGPRRQYRSGA